MLQKMIPKTRNKNLSFKNFQNKIDYPNISFHLIQGVNLEKNLALYLKNNEADILAMSTQSHNLVQKLFWWKYY
jgi:hypothetical protein